MTVSELRSKVRAVILGITGLLIAFLFARIVLDLIQAERTNPFVEFIKQISDFLSEPFESLATNDPGAPNLNMDAIVSIFLYFVIGLILSEIITAFIYDNVEDIIQNIVDALFKTFEFIFFLRIVFDFFEVNEKVKFINAVYELTRWSDGLLNVNVMDGRLNFSAVVILIIIIIFDILTESFVRGIFKSKKKEVSHPPAQGGYGSTVNHVNIAPIPTHSQPMQPMRQNITVNIPAQPPRQIPMVVQPTMAVPIVYQQNPQPTITNNTIPVNYERFNQNPQNAQFTENGNKPEGIGSKIKKLFRS